MLGRAAGGQRRGGRRRGPVANLTEVKDGRRPLQRVSGCLVGPGNVDGIEIGFGMLAWGCGGDLGLGCGGRGMPRRVREIGFDWAEESGFGTDGRGPKARSHCNWRTRDQNGLGLPRALTHAPPSVSSKSSFSPCPVHGPVLLMPLSLRSLSPPPPSRLPFRTFSVLPSIARPLSHTRHEGIRKATCKA